MTDEEIKEYWRTAYFNEKHKKEELEKENAELKESADFWEERYWILNDVYVKVANEKDIWLTNAKEIIKTILSSKTDFDERRFALWAWKEEVNKAEQFLKEIEK